MSGCYFMAGLLWSIFAVRMQGRLYGHGWMSVVVAVVNFVVWPLAIIIATIRLPIHNAPVGRTDEGGSAQ